MQNPITNQRHNPVEKTNTFRVFDIETALMTSVRIICACNAAEQGFPKAAGQ